MMVNPMGNPMGNPMANPMGNPIANSFLAQNPNMNLASLNANMAHQNYMNNNANMNAQ